MRKKIIVAILVFAFLLPYPGAVSSKIESYYSGDTISDGNRIYIGTANHGNFELFVLDNDRLIKTASILAPNDYQQSSGKFYGGALNIEGKKIYAYLVDGRYLYKYDITNVHLPVFVKREKDGQWDWFLGVKRFHGGVATISANNVKYWDKDLKLIDNFAIGDGQGHLSFSTTEKHFFKVKGGQLKVFDAKYRVNTLSVPADISDSAARSAFSDNSSGAIYLVDNSRLRKLNFDGAELASFKHTSNGGYDVAGQPDKSYAYFSDGVGVVKFDKKNLKPLDWANTQKTMPADSWAMGLKVDQYKKGERITVFNNSNILVLDGNLNPVARYDSQKDYYGSSEPLFIKADKTRAPGGAKINVHGGGFWPNETLIISFATTQAEIRADESGRFRLIMEVPKVGRLAADIKVTGKLSNLKYNLGFLIE